MDKDEQAAARALIATSYGSDIARVATNALNHIVELEHVVDLGYVVEVELPTLQQARLAGQQGYRDGHGLSHNDPHNQVVRLFGEDRFRELELAWVAGWREEAERQHSLQR